MSSRSPWPYVTLVAAAGALAVGLATARAIGVTPDGVVYLDAARHLAAGEGYVTAAPCVAGLTPLTRFAPLYPGALAVLVSLGADPMAAARLLSMGLLAINTFWVAVAVRHFVPGSVIAPIAAALFWCCSTVVFEIHTAALSEPLFLSFAIPGLLALQLYLERRRPLFLVAAGIAFAGASLARFAGASLVITAALVLLYDKRASFGSRLRATAVCCLLSVLPSILPLWRNQRLATAVAAVDAVSNPLSFEHLRALMVTMGSWLLPGTDRVQFFTGQDAILGLIVITALVAIVRRPWAGVETSPPIVFEVFPLPHVALLLVSIGFYSSSIPIDSRQLAPVFLCALVVAAHRIGAVSSREDHSGVRLIRAAVVALAGLHVVAAIAVVGHLRPRGRGYSGDEWQFDQLRLAVDGLEPDVVIFSDVPPAVYFLTARTACPLPADRRGLEEVAGVREKLGQERVAVVRFGERRRFPRRAPSGSDLIAPVEDIDVGDDAELRIVVRDRDATLARIVRRGAANDQ